MDTQQVIDDLIEFRNQRNWSKFHSLINLSRALSIESSEVEKIFQWKSDDSELTQADTDALKLELADVLIYAYYMCEKLNVNPNDVVEAKMQTNKQRHWKFEE